MTTLGADYEWARALVVRAEAQLDAVDELDGEPGETATAAVEALVDLYGAVLERVLNLATQASDAGLFGALAQDELVGHVLMAHGLLPAPPEAMGAPEPAGAPGPTAGRPAGPAPTGVPVQLTRRRTVGAAP